MNIRVCRAVRLCAVMLFVWPALAMAQDPYRQTVVVTAAASPVELGSVARTLMVISRDEIAALPVYSVADALRLLSSVDVRARGERGTQSDFSVRGAGFGQMLVLVDGVRLNDPQSGHHNGDIPVPLDEVERIEILAGGGSSLFGADAFGGTVNVITRRGRQTPEIAVAGGSFGSMGASGGAGLSRGSLAQTVSASVDRSHGFSYDRDFNTTILRSSTALGSASGVTASFLRREFGANNFYGGNAPSREWTNQTLLEAHHRLQAAAWTLGVNGSYRTHGDRFVFNQLNPLLSDSRHRTHVVIGELTASRRVAKATVTAGVEGGQDWIRSTNLGDHDMTRASAFAEWRQPFGSRVHVDGSLRMDRYTEFGASWSPSVSAGWWVSPLVRLRGSAGRSFRVPTFTERYYSDPQNLARAEVGTEHAWSGEGGVDLALPAGWLLQATLFARTDNDVIDWLRPTADDRWQTYNVRDIDTRGVDLGARRQFGNGAFLSVNYTGLDLDAPSVTQLSKYALDYAPRSLAMAALVPLPGRLSIAPRLEYRRRNRQPGSEEYVLLDARIARRFGPLVELRVDGTNLLDRSYHEVAGVLMPGAAMSVSLSIGR